MALGCGFPIVIRYVKTPRVEVCICSLFVPIYSLFCFGPGSGLIRFVFICSGLARLQAGSCPGTFQNQTYFAWIMFHMFAALFSGQAAVVVPDVFNIS